jgi:hypothetical protein
MPDSKLATPAIHDKYSIARILSNLIADLESPTPRISFDYGFHPDRERLLKLLKHCSAFASAIPPVENNVVSREVISDEDITEDSTDFIRFRLVPIRIGLNDPDDPTRTIDVEVIESSPTNLMKNTIERLSADNIGLKYRLRSLSLVDQLEEVKKLIRDKDRHNNIKSILEQDEILESLELDGVNIERLPSSMHTSGYRGRPFVSPANLVEAGFSQYSPSRIVNLATYDRVPKDKRIQHIRISGRTYLDGMGVQQLMDHEEKSLEGKLTPWAAKVGEYRGGGRKPKPRSSAVATESSP